MDVSGWTSEIGERVLGGDDARDHHAADVYGVDDYRSTISSVNKITNSPLSI